MPNSLPFLWNLDLVLWQIRRFQGERAWIDPITSHNLVGLRTSSLCLFLLPLVFRLRLKLLRALYSNLFFAFFTKPPLTILTRILKPLVLL